MDLLKRELERKKKSVQKAKSSSGGKRYFRAGDLRRQEEEESEKEAELLQNRKRKLAGEDEENQDGFCSKKSQRSKEADKEETKSGKAGEKESTSKASETATKTENTKSDEKEGENTAFKLSPEEISQRLRSLGYPIKLFGESSWDRLKRLRKALDEQKNVQAGLSEMEEFRLGRGHGIRNPFLEKESKPTEVEAHAEVSGEADPAAASKSAADGGKKEDDDYDLAKEDDPHKRIYKYFKGLVKKWEEDLNLRPEAVKKSVAGRNELKTLKQCKDYIR